MVMILILVNLSIICLPLRTLKDFKQSMFHKVYRNVSCRDIRVVEDT